MVVDGELLNDLKRIVVVHEREYLEHTNGKAKLKGAILHSYSEDDYYPILEVVDGDMSWRDGHAYSPLSMKLKNTLKSPYSSRILIQEVSSEELKNVFKDPENVLGHQLRGSSCYMLLDDEKETVRNILENNGVKAET